MAVVRAASGDIADVSRKYCAMSVTGMSLRVYGREREVKSARRAAHFRVSQGVKKGVTLQ